MPPRRLTDALGGLDPASRALLDLSLRQGVDDRDIAQLLGSDEDDVARRRGELIERIAAAHGGGRDMSEVEQELRDALAAEGQAAAAGQPDATGPAGPPAAEEQSEPVGGAPAAPADEAREDDSTAAPAAPADEAREDHSTAEPHAPGGGDLHRSQRRRRSMAIAALLMLALVAAFVVISIAASESDPGGEEFTSEPSTGADRAAPGARGEDERSREDDSPADRPAGDRARDRAVTLEPLPGAPPTAAGTATIVGEGEDARLELSVEDLPGSASAYEVWLYDSVIDSAPVGRIEADGTLSAPLPEDPAAFEFVDVSFERGGREAHSGLSVLRVPTDALTGS